MALKGNPSLSGFVAVPDCKIILATYSAISAGGTLSHLLRDDQQIAADILSNGEEIRIDANDAAAALSYSNYLRNGGLMSCEDWVAAGKPKYDSD